MRVRHLLTRLRSSAAGVGTRLHLRIVAELLARLLAALARVRAHAALRSVKLRATREERHARVADLGAIEERLKVRRLDVPPPYWLQ